MVVALTNKINFDVEKKKGLQKENKEQKHEVQTYFVTLKADIKSVNVT